MSVASKLRVVSGELGGGTDLKKEVSNESVSSVEVPEGYTGGNSQEGYCRCRNMSK